MAKVLTSGNFEAEVLGAQKPVLVEPGKGGFSVKKGAQE